MPPTHTEAGMPALKKSRAVRKGAPYSSSASSELTFGKEDMGRAIAAEMARTEEKTTPRGSPTVTPMDATRGMTTMDATA